MLRVIIAGRPNVGKSALLNRLVRRNISIVHDQPGVTRDRITATFDYEGKKFEFVDTGGIGLFETETTPKEIASAVQLQVDIAIESADVILFVVDGLEGLRPLDQEIMLKLRKSGKKIWLLVNKMDLPSHETRVSEFHELGLNPVFSVSAAHGRGMDSLWDALLKENKHQETAPNTESPIGRPARIAIVGRPNVGKSSLMNRLLGSDQVIVSDIPGTTRDSVELPVTFGKHHYSLIDTAGIRHKSSIRANVEMYSRHWSKKAITRADMVFLVLDSSEGATRQDCEIARMIVEEEKPCVILVNKWDLNEKLETQTFIRRGELATKRQKRRTTSRSEYEKEIRYRMPFLDYAPVMFISALQGYHALKVWKEIARLDQVRRTHYTTGILNRILARAQERVQPPMKNGKRLKIYYATQKIDTNVPTFVLFVNHRKFWVESYERYLINQLREENPLSGCPIIFQLKERVSAPPPKDKNKGEKEWVE